MPSRQRGHNPLSAGESWKQLENRHREPSERPRALRPLVSSSGLSRGPTVPHTPTSGEGDQDEPTRRRFAPALLARMDFRPAGLAEGWVLGPSPRMTSLVAAVWDLPRMLIRGVARFL